MPGPSASRPCPSRSSAAPESASTSKAPTPAPVGTPEELSAQRLHELAVRAFRIGNRGRLSLCEALRVLSETRLYLDLGFPSVAAYAARFFQLQRAEAFEYVRVAKALLELTELREAFGQGRIGWTVLKAITRVASVASQASWVEFLNRHGVEHTLAEARDALRRRRDTPRDGSYGLPNLDQKLILRFPRSDMDKVRAWIEDTCATIAEKTGGQEVSVEQALLFLCERDMISRRSAPPSRERSGSHGGSEDDDALPGSAASGVSYRAQVVYQRCPDCTKARVGTRDGFVEVSLDEILRYEGSAESVVIDGPTPPRLRRRILAREAGRCGNPHCHHRADHCHHIRLRSRGGKTELANEVAVCAICHALIHGGLLKLRGNANGDLQWTPVARGESIERQVGSDRGEADRLPVLRLVGQPGKPGASPEGRGESANADSSGRPLGHDDQVPAHPGLNLEDLAGALVSLGVAAGRARKLVAAAVASLRGAEITEADVLRTAIASI